MKNSLIKKRIISYILILLIIFFIFSDVASVVKAYNSKQLLNDHDFSIIKKIIKYFFERLIENIKPPDDIIIINNQTYNAILIETITVEIDNTTKTVDMLDEDEEILELYNSRLGIKSPNFTFTVLPEEARIFSENEVNTTLENISFIDILGNDTVIGFRNKIIRVPIDEMVRNITRHQSINSLNKYEVKNLFSELNNSDLFENILYYSIDWGDGSPLQTFYPTQKEITHFYKDSGTYLQILYITDISGETYTFTNTYIVEYEGHLLHTYFIFDEYKEPIVTTTTGIGLIAIIGYALTESGKYKILALLTLMIPMYTRIQKDDALDNFVRGEIYGLIKTKPGICYNDIMKKLDIKNGTLSYHLHKLEKMELIKSRREGLKYRAFYSKDISFPEEERFRLTGLQVDILNTIKSNNGITQRELAKKLNKKPQTINYNIKVLRQSELIKICKKGRKTYCLSL